MKSKRGTQFRIWATQTLKDHLVRGNTLNERRLRGNDSLSPTHLAYIRNLRIIAL